jgi:PhnB protein
MPQISTYIRFTGNCREAMTFYQSVLGGTLNMQTIGETPMRDHMPPPMHERILHAELRGEGFGLMASDMAGPDGVTIGNAFSVVLVCASKAETEALFAQLAEGGKVGHPLEQAFFGTIGDCIDRFGIPWMLQGPGAD